MFIPSTGKTYSSDVSDLAIKVLSTQYRDLNEGILKLSLVITNKRNGIFYEAKVYIVRLQDIQHWKEI